MDRSGVTRVKIEPPEERSSLEEKAAKVFNPWFGLVWFFCAMLAESWNLSRSCQSQQTEGLQHANQIKKQKDTGTERGKTRNGREARENMRRVTRAGKRRSPARSTGNFLTGTEVRENTCSKLRGNVFSFGDKRRNYHDLNLCIFTFFLERSFVPVRWNKRMHR